MDWLVIAQNDWDFYYDTTRIAKYVQLNNITSDQYQEITGEPSAEQEKLSKFKANLEEVQTQQVSAQNILSTEDPVTETNTTVYVAN